MHIPDGYLSPSSCATLYAAAVPFWSAALRKLRREMQARFIPLVSLFAAFSFVIMMFNVPLPGGTSGHAIGVGIAAAVLGPWASMIALSITLLIQALLFGDGGITALGANCFNMAIYGSIVLSVVYRYLGRRTPLASRRRMVACALGGYLAINVSALLAAVELGIQPMLFKDPAGAPPYAPYPLHISIPVMMLGHLTVAGMAEALISGAAFAYLQRTNSSLLECRTRPMGPEAVRPSTQLARSPRRLWSALTILMVLTPFGLLASGAAWAEWSPRDFRVRRDASRSPCHRVTWLRLTTSRSGSKRLSMVWTAPIPNYAPSLYHSRGFGYLMSALVGGGVVILGSQGVGWAVARGTREYDG